MPSNYTSIFENTVLVPYGTPLTMRKRRISTIVLPNGHVFPIPLKYEELGETPIKDNTFLRKGGFYSLQGEECEGFTMPIRVYECKGICNEIKGIPLDAVIMKLVEGQEDTIFSLTRQDCHFLNVDFEPQLQLFPSRFSWKEVTQIRNKEEFTRKNLATYPPSPRYGTIRQMHIYIHGFKKVRNDEYIVTPNGKHISISNFLSSMYIRFKNDEMFRKHNFIWKVMTPFKDVNDYYDNGGIHIMLFFANGTEKGIDPSLFENKNIDDIIEVGWTRFY